MQSPLTRCNATAFSACLPNSPRTVLAVADTIPAGSTIDGTRTIDGSGSHRWPNELEPTTGTTFCPMRLGRRGDAGGAGRDVFNSNSSVSMRSRCRSIATACESGNRSKSDSAAAAPAGRW